MQRANSPTPFDGRRFFRDFVDELRRLAQNDEPLPYFPQPAWWRALRIADDRDRTRFVSELNGRDDGKGGADYFNRQRTYTPGNGNRTSTAFTIPQVDTYQARANAHDRYRRKYVA